MTPRIWLPANLENIYHLARFGDHSGTPGQPQLPTNSKEIANDKSAKQWRTSAGTVVAQLVVGGAIGLGSGHAQVPNPPRPGGGLKVLPPDKQVEAIDRQFLDFDMAMFEVNYRYIEMNFAAIEGNWDYALYTGEKMAWAIQNRFERRPKRRPNAEAIFLKEVYPSVLDAIRKKDIALFKERFGTLCHTCNACHAAEKVPFIQVGVPRSSKRRPLTTEDHETWLLTPRNASADRPEICECHRCTRDKMNVGDGVIFVR